MKKRILIFCTVITAFSLTALGYMGWNNTAKDHKGKSCSKPVVVDYDLVNPFNDVEIPDLVYNVDSRFVNTVTREKLHNAKSIADILPEKATSAIKSYRAVRVSILHEGEEISETGLGDVLNTAQKELMQSTDYSTNIRISADTKRQDGDTGESVYYDLVYYMTIIPENEAEFASGQDALIEYLKENSRDKTAIITQDKLKPGRVNFTVTKNGEIANVKLDSTCGYPSVDEALIEMISAMQGKWNPATNSQGEKVDQELIFFFGRQGC